MRLRLSGTAWSRFRRLDPSQADPHRHRRAPADLAVLEALRLRVPRLALLRVDGNLLADLQVHLEAMHAHSSPAWQTLDAFVELQKSVSSGGQLHPAHAPLSSRPGAAKVE